MANPTLTDTSIIAVPFGPGQSDRDAVASTSGPRSRTTAAPYGRPGNLDSPAAAVCVSSILAQLPKRIAKGAAHEPGQRLVIDVTGSVVVRQGFHVELDQDGRLRGHAVSEPQQDPGTTTISPST